MTTTPVPMPTPGPRAPSGITPPPTGPTTSVTVKHESFFRSTPVSVRIEIRAGEADAVRRLDAAFELARRQLAALTPPRSAGTNAGTEAASAAEEST